MNPATSNDCALTEAERAACAKLDRLRAKRKRHLARLQERRALLERELPRSRSAAESQERLLDLHTKWAAHYEDRIRRGVCEPTDHCHLKDRREQIAECKAMIAKFRAQVATLQAELEKLHRRILRLNGPMKRPAWAPKLAGLRYPPIEVSTVRSVQAQIASNGFHPA
jgi:DNA repair exonuclease SbcCD ATPase subunit